MMTLRGGFGRSCTGQPRPMYALDEGIGAMGPRGHDTDHRSKHALLEPIPAADNPGG